MDLQSLNQYQQGLYKNIITNLLNGNNEIGDPSLIELHLQKVYSEVANGDRYLDNIF